jgi:hypothetical protein
VTTPGLGEWISGAILYDETIRQTKKDGTPFIKVIVDAGIIPDSKVDIGDRAARWMDLPVEDARHWMLSTASLSIVGYEHTLAGPAIILWNDDHHVKPGA